MRITLRKLLGQFIHFLMVSGIGWLIDFSLYTVMGKYTRIPPAWANMISGIPALTFVFCISTRKIFQKAEDGLPTGIKYVIYFMYQMVLLFLVSHLCEFIFDVFVGIIPQEYRIGEIYIKLISKVCITPITMICNFIVMKLLSEKV